MKKGEIGLFLIRIVVGMTFLLHGLDKYQSGLGNVADYFASLGLPGYLAYIIAVIEFIGGIALIVGYGTRVVGVVFAIVMLGAIITVKLPEGFIGGYELDALLLATSIHLAISGSSFLSLEQYIINSRKSMFSA
ncbi:DoxX family protein [Salipaludibacillus daqingensis]|uniref:DoxX family protein n=1 Tax=Salipaludibacillus daqingensis TaxID=3041001 RepID=UPI0024753A36|nr:DoxX family protein [Salipaludibacillus daqingensis]